MERLLQGLRAVGEPTRLRILALCGHSELTVSDLTQILGQSQPRVSRHLKLMVDAGLLDRFREGQWAYYRIAQQGRRGELAQRVVDLVPADDPQHALDLERLERVKRQHAEQADAYFRNNASRWDQIRSKYVDDAKVEKALRRLLPAGEASELLDIGTGTGRVLEVLSDRVSRAVGIDRSREMLAVARANLERADLRRCQVRQADMYKIPSPPESFDAATIHLVLHYAEQPAAVIGEAARVLRPNGKLIVVDYAPHDLEELRSEHQHRRLGFADGEVHEWFRAAGLVPGETVRLKGKGLTVCLWPAMRPANDAAAALPQAGSA